MEGRVLSKVKFHTKFPAIPALPTVAFRSTADETKEPKLLVTEGAASVTLASLYGGLSSHGSFWRHFFLANRERGPRAGDPCGPGHRYIWVGTCPYCDLSCEPE
jgi:hypothetical protein